MNNIFFSRIIILLHEREVEDLELYYSKWKGNALTPKNNYYFIKLYTFDTIILM